MTHIHQLTDLQVAVMRVLWEKQEATVAEIWESLRAERGLAQTTIATLLSRLEKRGVVAHSSRARQFVYRALVTESEVRRAMVRDLTERLFDGDIAALMSHLLTARDMTVGDLERVRSLVEAETSGEEADHAKD